MREEVERLYAGIEGELILNYDTTFADAIRFNKRRLEVERSWAEKARPEQEIVQSLRDQAEQLRKEIRELERKRIIASLSGRTSENNDPTGRSDFSEFFGESEDDFGTP